jgi:hypothetical protein
MQMPRNTAQVIYNQYMTAAFGKDGYAFQIDVLKEFVMIFDGEYWIFLQIQNLYLHETSFNVFKKATRCW